MDDILENNCTVNIKSWSNCVTKCPVFVPGLAMDPSERERAAA